MNGIRIYDDEDNSYLLEQTIFPDKGVLYQQRNVCAQQKINLVQCRLFLTKVIAVINKGEKYNKEEATEIFFSATKLFYCSSIPLRQLLLTALRSLIPFASDVFVVMNSLSKDASSEYDFQRSSALRTLGMILTDQTINSLERHYKQGIIDKNSNVQANALATACKLAFSHGEVVSKWMPEILTALSSHNHVVQYQAIRLLQILKRNDKIALIRYVVTYGKEKPLRSPLAHMQLIKICGSILKGEKIYGKNLMPLVEYLQTALRPNNELVCVEAIKLASQLELDCAPQSLSVQLMNTLQGLLQSGRTLLRFVAIRTIHELSTRYNELVSTVRVDVEGLLRDNNKTILTLAIATSLSICNETSMDGLLNKVSKFMPELPDSFKNQVIATVENLAEKYPTKYMALLQFLNSCLNIKGVKFQTGVVNTIHKLCTIQPKIRETALNTLADYIEDCEYSEIIMKVFTFIGEEGPKSKKPMKYIRCIYNRLLLESPIIRAAAVTTLSKFAEIKEIRPSVIEILKKCAYDNDEEVRERACFYTVYLETPNEEPIEKIDNLINEKTDIMALQCKIEQYLSNGGDQPFALFEEIKNCVIEEPVEEIPTEEKKKEEIIGEYGKILNQNEVVLTTAGSEYEISCNKMIYAKNIVLLYTITNTLPDYSLTDISMDVQIEKGDYKIIEQSTIQQLLPQQSDIIKVVLDRPINVFGKFVSKMKYILKENVEDDFGDEDEYVIDSMMLTLGDFVLPIEVADVAAQFESLASEVSKTQVYKLTRFKTLQIAVDELTKLFGLSVVNGSNDTKNAQKKHVLWLAGELLMEKNAPTFMRLRMLCDQNGVTVEVCIRTTDANVPGLLLSLL